MTSIEPTRKQMAELLENIPDNMPLVMVNFLKFKDKVIDSGLTGREQYIAYIQAFMPFGEKAGIKIIWSGKPLMYFIGNEEDVNWDNVLMVEYPSKQHFLDMIREPNYPHELRNKALVNSKLIVSVTTMPN